MNLKRSRFPLFTSHLDLAHRYWASIITSETIAIDATCGNGHDTIALVKMGARGVYAIDIQPEALNNAKKLAEAQLSQDVQERIVWILSSHEVFPPSIVENSVACIVYNLGYLPGGDKSLTTQMKSTLISLKHSLKLLQPGGCISITCYPGHPEGENEEKYLLDFSAGLDPKEWSCCHHRWLNRNKAPSLLIIQKQLT